MNNRSPRLRPDRPFKISHGYWFGNGPLNGMVWEIQTLEDGKPWMLTVRDGGPFNTSLAEAIAWVRSARRERRYAARLGFEPVGAV